MTDNITDAQKAVLGCIMIDSKYAMPICVDNSVEAAWFWDDARKLYEVCLARFIDSKISDLFTVGEEFTGFARECMDEALTVTNLEGYLETLRNEWIQDKAVKIIAVASHKLEAGVPDIVTLVENTSKELATLTITDKKEVDMIAEGEQMINHWQFPDPNIPFLTWALDEMADGLGKITDQYIVIAAEPSVGKTSLTLDLMLHWGKQGIMSSMAQLESPPNRITSRLIANIGSINTWHLENHPANDEDFDHAREALATLKTLPLSFTFSGMNIQQIRSWAQREKDKGSRLLIVDNMKAVRHSHKNKSTPEIFMELSASLNQIRHDVRLPMIVLHHLAQTGEMAWSSDILRDVDINITMKECESKSIKGKNGEPGLDIIEMFVAKHRDGDKYMYFYPQFIKRFQRWKSMANREVF